MARESEMWTRLKAEGTDVGTISGVITDTTSKHGKFVCLRVDTVNGKKCDQTKLFKQAQEFCATHKNKDIKEIAADMTPPHAWKTIFDEGKGQTVGPHVSLNLEHMKKEDLGQRNQSENDRARSVVQRVER